MDWGQTLSVVFTGMTVVFLALIILIFLIWVMGKVFSGAETKKKQKVAVSAPTAETKPAPAVPVQAVAVESENGLTDEVVVAIAAAIHCVMSAEGCQVPFAIKSIKRVTGAGNAWNMAGVLENTRPF